MADEVSRDTTPFGDWRIRLGIVLGVLTFCMSVVVWSLVAPSPEALDAASHAWVVIGGVTVAALGIAAATDIWGKHD